MNNCTCNKNDELRIVRGNAFAIRLTVSAIHIDGTPVENFVLGDSEAVLKVMHLDAKTPKEFIVIGNDAVISFGGDLSLGWYGLEMTGTFNGKPWRWCVPQVFQVVETNAKANIPAWAVMTDETYAINGVMTITSGDIYQSDWNETDPQSPSYIKNKPTKLADFDQDSTHRVVSDEQIAAWNAKYDKPSGGIPKSDLDSSVQTSLGKADTAIQDVTQIENDIADIEDLIPAQASTSNQLADKDYVDDGIATASATYRGAYNLVSDLELTVAATEQQIAAALATKMTALGITPDNNDYCFVQVPTADATPTEIARVDRYKYNGTAWAFEFSLNNSGFTSEQWAALNSGITSGLVTKLSDLPTNSELTTMLGGKEDKSNKVTSLSAESTDTQYPSAKCVYDLHKQNADDIDAIEEKIPSGASSSNKMATASDITNLSDSIAAILLLIPSAASSLNQLADKAFVNSSIATNTATYRGSYNLVSDLSLTISATEQQIAAALATKMTALSITPENNDYCFVQVPTADATPTEISRIDRYKYNGTAWLYEYSLNNSSFTSAQWAAINSGITNALVAKLSVLPTNAELTTALGVLTDGIAAINAKIPSAATSSNKLVDNTAMQSYVAQIVNALDATFNITSSDGHVTVQITQTNGVITALAITTSDIASAAALNLLSGRVTTAEGNISTNATDIANLQQLYNNLQQSDPIIIEPTDTWPVANPSTHDIYRVIDRVNTPPQYYSDYMWNGTTMVLMAQYDNAIDDEPTPGSNNLVKSGGVAANIVYDISRANASGSTLATYADLAAALGTNGANVPASIRRGGMSVKFVQSSDNKYVQYRYMETDATTDATFTKVANWQGVDEEIVSYGDNLAKSKSTYNSILENVNFLLSLFDGSCYGETEEIIPTYEAGTINDNGNEAASNTYIRTNLLTKGKYDKIYCKGAYHATIKYFGWDENDNLIEKRVFSYSSGQGGYPILDVCDSCVKYRLAVYINSTDVSKGTKVNIQRITPMRIDLEGCLFDGIYSLNSAAPENAENKFGFAKEAGTYTNFKDNNNQSIVIADEGLWVLYNKGNGWVSQNIFIVDDAPDYNTSKHFVYSDAVYSAIKNLQNEIYAELYGRTFSQPQYKYNWYLGPDGSITRSNYSCLVDVSKLGNNHITEVTNVGIQYAFLKSYDLTNNRAVFAKGASRITGTVNNTLIPIDANYLYMYLGNSSSVSLPTLKIEEGEIEGVIQSIDEEIGNIESVAFNRIIAPTEFQNRHITEDGAWVANSSSKSAFIDVSKAKGCYITQISGTLLQYAFCKSYDENGVEFTKNGSRVKGTLNSTLIPDDCEYIYIGSNSSHWTGIPSFAIRGNYTQDLLISKEVNTIHIYKKLYRDVYLHIPIIHNTAEYAADTYPSYYNVWGVKVLSLCRYDLATNQMVTIESIFRDGEAECAIQVGGGNGHSGLYFVGGNTHGFENIISDVTNGRHITILKDNEKIAEDATFDLMPFTSLEMTQESSLGKAYSDSADDVFATVLKHWVIDKNTFSISSKVDFTKDLYVQLAYLGMFCVYRHAEGQSSEHYLTNKAIKNNKPFVTFDTSDNWESEDLETADPDCNEIVLYGQKNIGFKFSISEDSTPSSVKGIMVSTNNSTYNKIYYTGSGGRNFSTGETLKATQEWDIESLDFIVD